MFATTDLDVAVSSAGTLALVSESMPTDASALSREFGGDPSHHVATQLSRELIVESDLVLTMAREHRGSVARLVPFASRKTFTLLEFARILDGLPSAIEVLPPAGDLAAWLAQVSSHRGYFGVSSTADDVIDPYRRSAATYRRSIEQIAPAVATIVRTQS